MLAHLLGSDGLGAAQAAEQTDVTPQAFQSLRGGAHGSRTTRRKRSEKNKARGQLGAVPQQATGPPLAQILLAVYQALQAVGVAPPPAPAGGIAALLPGLLAAPPKQPKDKRQKPKPKRSKDSLGKDTRGPRGPDGSTETRPKGDTREAPPTSAKPAPWVKRDQDAPQQGAGLGKGAKENSPQQATAGK
eukprot:12050192-Alexandrium_andersonii.AAC.1